MPGGPKEENEHSKNNIRKSDQQVQQFSFCVLDTDSFVNTNTFNELKNVELHLAGLPFQIQEAKGLKKKRKRK